MAFLKFILLLSLPRVTPMVYREFELLDQSDVLKFGVADLQIPSGVLMPGKSGKSLENPKTQNLTLNSEGFSSIFLYLDLSKINEDSLDSLLEYIPENTEIFMMVRGMGPTKGRWLASCLKNQTTNPTRLTTMTIFADFFVIFGTAGEALREEGINLGIMRQHGYQLNLPNIVFNFEEDSSSIHVLHIIILEDAYFDYDSFSRSLDQTYNEIVNYTNVFHPEMLLSVSTDLKEISPQGTLPSKEFFYEYELMLARFTYTWGASNRQRVVYSRDSSYDEGDPGWLRDLMKIWTEGSSMEENTWFRLSDERFLSGKMMQLVCSDFNQVMISVDTPAFQNFSVEDHQIFERSLLSQNIFMELHNTLKLCLHQKVSYLLVVADQVNATFLNKLLDIVLNTAEVNLLGKLHSVIFKMESVDLISEDNDTVILDLWKNLDVSRLQNASISLGFTEVSDPLEQTISKLFKNHVPFPPQKLINMSQVVFLKNQLWVPPVDVTRKSNRNVGNQLLELHGRIQEMSRVTGEKEIIVEGYFSDKHLNKVYQSCFGFKRYWTMVRNWAKIGNYGVQVATREILGDPWAGMLWFKMPFIPLEFSHWDEEQLNFYSNFKDHCVVLDETPPKKYSDWSSGSQAGVTFNLTRPPFQSMKSKWLGGFLSLIHYKFKTIELVIAGGSTTSKTKSKPKIQYNLDPLAEAIYSLENNMSGTKSSSNGKSPFQYYINLGAVDNLPKNINLGQFNKSMVSIRGAHFEVSKVTGHGPGDKSYWGEKAFNLRKRLQSIREYVPEAGISFPYMDNLRNETEKMLLRYSDYVIVDINIPEVLLNFIGNWFAHAGKLRGNSSKEAVYNIAEKYFQMFPDQRDFYHLFDALRNYRIDCKKQNPKIRVMARIKFPIVLDSKYGMENYWRVWKFMEDFSSTYDFPFFVYEAFGQDEHQTLDSKEISRKIDKDKDGRLAYGWWRGQNEKSLRDPTKYIENQAVHYGNDTRRPSGDFTEEKKEAYINEETSYTLVGVALLFSVVVFGLVVRVWRQKKIITDFEMREFQLGRKTTGADDHIFSGEYQKERYEIGEHEFSKETSTLIGVGNFGVVYKTVMPRFNRTVAVKMPKSPYNCAQIREEVKSFLREIKIMSYVGQHVNILTLLGAFTRDIQKGVVLLITEFCENGSLIDNLREIPRDAGREIMYDLYRFCQEIAIGMQYLADKRVIHGDLSARNVLLAQNKVCKISDFGLSRKLEKNDMYQMGLDTPLPWAWMSIESLLRREFTVRSDTWSLGVTFWEIFSLGEQPFGGLQCTDEFKQGLQDGSLRLGKPSRASEQIFNEILNCCQVDPTARPQPEFFARFFQSQMGLVYD